MIAAHVPDLMDRSRFGVGVQFVGAAGEVGDAALVVVDLDRCTDIGAFAALPARTVGFCSHVDGERMVSATDAGFDEVLPRSVFFRRLPELLAGGEGAGAPSGG